MKSGSFSLPPLDRLPSGRHRLTRAAVAESQRGRLLFAIAQVVAEKGYAAVTVADIVDRASVSRSTFYEQFEDKEACFLAAFNLGVEYVLGQMREAWEARGGNDAGGWRDHLRSDLTTYLEVLASEPAFARALHLESLAAGPATLERRAQMLALFSDRTRRLHTSAREQEPMLDPLPVTAFLIHTGGLDELVRDWLRTRTAQSLPELTDDAAAATFALLGARP